MVFYKAFCIDFQRKRVKEKDGDGEREKERVKERKGGRRGEREGEPSLLCFFTQSSQRKRNMVNLT